MIPALIRKGMESLGYTSLLPVQEEVLLYMDETKDLFIQAETGSGKTVSYLFPIIGQMLISGVPENPFISNETKEDEKKNQQKIKKKIQIQKIKAAKRKKVISVKRLHIHYV
jgi:Lhr-like helicase